MPDIFEVLRRADDGPYIKENDFDMKIYRTACRLIKEHEIKFDREKVIVGDNKMADQVFAAGLKLAVELGMYVMDTSRVIEFTEEELLEAAYMIPKEFVLGEGKDSRIMRARTINDGHHMTVCGGCPGVPIEEDIFLPFMISYAKEPLIDIIIPASLTEIEGMSVKTGGPLEVHACRQEMIWTREALERVGRPGMHIYAAGESSATELGALAICNERYMRRTDSHMVPVLSELKTDNARLIRVMAGLEYGAFSTSLIDPIIGGFAGGSEGVAVVLAAALLLSTAAYGVQMHCIHPIHNKYISVSTKEAMWVDSIVGRAFARNAPLAILADAWTTAGAGTKAVLYEAAALAICQECSALHTDSLSVTNGVYPNASGLENRFFAEVVHAIFRQSPTPEEANELVLTLFGKYQDGFENPDLGKHFTEVYDIKTITPKPDWLDLYKEVKDEVANLGVEFIV